MSITDSDRQEWSHHPVTQEFLQHLRDSRQETMECWAREHFIGDTAEKTLAQNAKALGGLDVLEQSINRIEGYRYDDI